MSLAKVEYKDGMTLEARDLSGKLRPGILEILASQVYVQFTDHPDGVFMDHKAFFDEQKAIRLMGLRTG